ncbi:MAG: DUF5309 domain-containing protein [bacterium]|nr:DUF5309 domain-containing protein [bacterium]
MAQYITPLTTYQEINETRNVRDVGPKILYYDPDAAPLITMMNALKRRRAVKSTHCEWYEKDRLARWAVNQDYTAANAGSVTVNVADGTKFVAGDCFIVPPIKGTYAIGEMIRVVSVSTNALTVSRNVGGSGLQVIVASQPLRIIGPMFEEYSSFPSQKRAIPTRKETYLQIVRTPTQFSNTAIATNTYGTAGRSDRDLAHIEDMVEHKQKMNSVLIWGQASQSLQGGPTSYPIRSTMGLIETITTNVTDVSGTLTYKKFVAWSRTLFRYGNKKRKLGVFAPIIVEAIQAWGVSHLMVTPRETKFGMQILEVQTPHGTIDVVRDWMLENDPNDAYGWGNIGIGLDMAELTFLYLNNNGINRDTKVYRDVIQNGADGKSDEILTEFGYKVQREKHHGILANVTDYMA